MQFGPKEHRWTFTLNGQTLATSKVERDLGVLISDDLNWTEQVRATTSRARTTAHSLARALVSKDSRTWVDLFRTFVRPRIEYAASAWIPHEAGHLTTLGSVQRWFTKQIPGIGKLDHEEREKICGLTPVANRIARGVAIETFKILTGNSGVSNNILQTFEHDHDTRGREAGDLVHIKPNKNFRKFSFAAAAPRIWNEINVGTRNSPSTNCFKNSFDEHHTDIKIIS